jgi:hypothetical protein
MTKSTPEEISDLLAKVLLAKIERAIDDMSAESTINADDIAERVMQNADMTLPPDFYLQLKQIIANALVRRAAEQSKAATKQ